MVICGSARGNRQDPAVAAVRSLLMLGQRPDAGVAVRPGRRWVRVLAQQQGMRPAPCGERRRHEAEAAAHKCRRRGMNSSVNSTNTSGISWVIEISA
jgi:hypothetical protein